MFKTTQRIREALMEEYGCREGSVNAIEGDGCEAVYLFVRQNQHQLMQYEFVCEADGCVTLNSSAIAYVPKEKTDAVLKIINDRNVWAKFGFAKLYMQPDGEVRSVICLSDKHSIDSIGKVAVGVLASMESTVDEAYPRLMQCIWGEEKEGSDV